MTFSIDKDVPLQRAGTRGCPAFKYPWRQMEIGDSFLVPINLDIPGRVVNRFRQAARSYSYGNPEFRIAHRRVGDDYRVWRTA